MTAETLNDPALDFFEEAPFEAFRLASATSALFDAFSRKKPLLLYVCIEGFDW